MQTLIAGRSLQQVLERWREVKVLVDRKWTPIIEVVDQLIAQSPYISAIKKAMHRESDKRKIAGHKIKLPLLMAKKKSIVSICCSCAPILNYLIGYDMVIS